MIAVRFCVINTKNHKKSKIMRLKGKDHLNKIFFRQKIEYA